MAVFEKRGEDQNQEWSRFWHSALGFWRGPAAWRIWLVCVSLIAIVILQLYVQFRLTLWNRNFFDDQNGVPDALITVNKDTLDADMMRIRQELRDFFGGARLSYTIEDVVDPNCILQLGVAPIRIGLMSTLPGCSDFSARWKRRVESRFGGVPTQYIGLQDLISNKEATDRPQDRADAGVLRCAATQKTLRERPKRPQGKRRS